MVEEVVKPKLTPAYTSSKLCEFIQIWSKDANINIYKPITRGKQDPLPILIQFSINRT